MRFRGGDAAFSDDDIHRDIVRQTAKQTANASVLTNSTRIARPDGMGAAVCPWSGFPVLKRRDRLRTVDQRIEREAGTRRRSIRDLYGVAANNHAKPRHA